MQRKFLINLSILLILNLLIKPFWILGIDRTVQNVVGSAEYGFYYALFNFSFLFNILLDCGITNFNNKNIAQNGQLLNKHLSSLIVLRGFLALIYILVTLAAGMIIGYDAHQLSILTVLGFNQVLISFILYLRSNIAGLHLFKTDSFLSVLDRLIMITICGFLLWGNIAGSQFRITWFIGAQTASYIITTLVTLVIVIDRARLKKLNTSRTFFIMILKKSYPYAILVLLMTFYNRIDSVMLERMLSDGRHQAGVYASAYRLLDSANMVAFLFAGLLLPMFARMIKLKQPVEELVHLAFSLLVVPAITIAILSSFYSEYIMSLLYRDHISESSDIFGILMFCFVPISTTYIFGTLLTSNGNMKELNIMAGAGMLINITLNLLFIPVFKAEGAALSSLTTQMLTALSQVVIVQLLFRFRINYRFLVRLVLFILGCILLNHLIVSTAYPWLFKFLTSVASCMIYAFGLRLISLKSLVHILRYG
jgi:O-antigen/teichoic acid export membrane protein